MSFVDKCMVNPNLLRILFFSGPVWLQVGKFSRRWNWWASRSHSLQLGRFFRPSKLRCSGGFRGIHSDGFFVRRRGWIHPLKTAGIIQETIKGHTVIVHWIFLYLAPEFVTWTTFSRRMTVKPSLFWIRKVPFPREVKPWPREVYKNPTRFPIEKRPTVLERVVLFVEAGNPLIKGILAAPPQSYPSQEIAGLIKGLLTIGFP